MPHAPRKTIWMLAWPVILDQAFQTMVQYVDSAMVGSLGAVATAAVAANTSTIWLVNGLMYSFGIAGLSRSPNGAGNKEGPHTVRQALMAALFFSVLTTSIMGPNYPRLPLG